MSEEKKETPAEAPAAENKEVPGYMQDQTSKKQQSVEKAKERIERERDEMSNKGRFGFFSIPFAPTINDGAYSRPNEYNHKVVEGAVITEPRGIYTHVMRSGKGPDVYFSVEAPFSHDDIEKEKAFREAEKKKLFDLVDKRRKKEDGTGRATFKYPGPQEMTGFYKEKSEIPKQPLYKEEDRFKHIGADRQVIIEKRGIMTSPTKLGTCLYPKDYFSFYFTPKEVTDRCVEARNQEEAKKLEKVKMIREKLIPYKKPFFPASLKKCDCFASDKQAYGILNDGEIKDRLAQYKEDKKTGNPKYEKKLPPGAIKHVAPFRPARLLYSGRDGLFNDDLYKMPNLPPEQKLTLKERLELEEKNKKPTFRYNKLMQHSHFSPCISSFNCNLKRDFPTIKFN